MNGHFNYEISIELSTKTYIIYYKYNRQNLKKNVNANLIISESGKIRYSITIIRFIVIILLK